MSNVIDVGMADFRIAKGPYVFTVAGLGSCVAVCVYDAFNKIGGLAHIMLPMSTIPLRGTPKKYADKAIELMVGDLLKGGAQRSRLVAKITGGSQMFSFPDKANTIRIGDRNIQTTEQELKRLNIPLLAADVGGNLGRTVRFDLDKGQLFVRTINRGEKVI